MKKMLNFSQLNDHTSSSERVGYSDSETESSSPPASLDDLPADFIYLQELGALDPNDDEAWAREFPSAYNIDFDDPNLLAGLIRTMLAQTPVGYTVLDRQFNVQYVNDYYLKLRKLTLDETVGARCFDLANRGKPCPICVVREAMASGRSQSLTRKDVLEDGTVTYIEDQAVPLFNEDGQTFDYVLEIMVDRTRVMRLRDKVNQAFHNIIRMLVSVLEKKDRYTSTHSADVSTISAKLARFIGLDEEAVYTISLGALLHDIGKVLVPDGIINKPAGLTEEEFDRMRQHPVESFKLLSNLEGFAEIKEICLRHHERWDGRGYPGALAGDLCPLGGHIVGLADTYDAMTSDRSYRRGLSHETALAEIERSLGSQFHPELGRQFLALARGPLGSRQALIAKDHKALQSFLENRKGTEVSRVLHRAEIIEPRIARPAGGYRFDQRLITQVFRYTPAFYAIISDSFDLLYASDSLGRALKCPVSSLIGRKCYEINHKNMSCLMDGDDLSCPGLRALKTGLPQKGEVEEFWGGAPMNFDVYTAPIDIIDLSGRPVNCILEIMFDRTDEVTYKRAVSRDFKSLIRTLENLIKRIEPDQAGNSEEIIRQCDSLGEFLTRFHQEVSQKYLNSPA